MMPSGCRRAANPAVQCHARLAMHLQRKACMAVCQTVKVLKERHVVNLVKPRACKGMKLWLH